VPRCSAGRTCSSRRSPNVTHPTPAMKQLRRSQQSFARHQRDSRMRVAVAGPDRAAGHWLAHRRLERRVAVAGGEHVAGNRLRQLIWSSRDWLPSTHRRHTWAQTRQCSCIPACRSHSSPHELHAWTTLPRLKLRRVTNVPAIPSAHGTDARFAGHSKVRECGAFRDGDEFLCAD
jgi:hypothetical protein